MRVLYVLDIYPLLSESYIRTEIDFFRRRGHQLMVWARTSGTAAYQSDVPVVYGGSPLAAFMSFRPDIVHTHYLPNAVVYADAFQGRRPFTVRGHVVDYSRPTADQLVAREAVDRLFLFPHFAANHRGSRKVVPVTAAYDPLRYQPGVKDPRLVVRAATGRSRKALENFVRIAAALKGEYRFVMPITRPDDWAPYVDSLMKLSASLGSPVEFMVNCQHDAVAALVAKAAICLRAHDPTFHQYGMPVSIAEAMGSGCQLVALDDPLARAYMEDTALYYQSDGQAIGILADLRRRTPEEWRAAMLRSLALATRYAADTVLSRIEEEWKALV